MRINKTKYTCCGCSACVNACPKGAIKMVSDRLGFKYPEVDDDLCIDCGLCNDICSFNPEYDTSLNIEKPLAYACRLKDINEVDKSQSGGAFVAISDMVLENGGIVYGVGYDKNFNAMHKRATTKFERDEFRGSKYVQSDLSNIFTLIKKDLSDGLIVLFSGTPCQTSGLASFVGSKLREKLILVDLVCHGVPGPKVWTDYLKMLEQKSGKTIVSVNFRNKSVGGWHSHIETVKYDDGSTFADTLYTKVFYANIAMRKSCSECHFTNLKRPSDITICDCWGAEQTDALYLAEDNRGCSLLLVNTKKGQSIFEKIISSIDYKEINIDELIQPNMQYPSRLHPKREEYEKVFDKKGFLYSEKKFLEKNLFRKTLSLGYKLTPKCLKKIYCNLRGINYEE